MMRMLAMAKSEPSANPPMRDGIERVLLKPGAGGRLGVQREARKEGEARKRTEP